MQSQAIIQRAAPPLSRSSLLADLRADLTIYLFIAAYACVVSLVATHIGEQRKMVPLSIYLGVLGGVIYFLLLVAAVAAVMLAVPRWRAHFMAVVGVIPAGLMVIALMVFMCVFSSMKQMLPDLVPFYADPALASIDAFLHGGTDPWRLTHAAVPQGLVPLLEKLYLVGWGCAKLAATFAALFLPRLRHVRRQYLWTLLIIWVVLGNVVAGAVMSGGPVFYERITGNPRFVALNQYLATQTGQIWVQDFLWTAYTGNGPGVTGQGISAFPSLHVASTVLCALLAVNAGRVIGIAATALLAAILLGSVYFGWHYAIDGYISIVATVAVWKIVGMIEHRARVR